MGAITQWMWKSRIGLTPIWLLLGTLTFGPLANWQLDLTSICLILIVGFAPWSLWARAARMPSRAHTVLADVTYMCIAAWIVAAKTMGWANWRPLLTAATAATLILGTFWWTSRRNRIRVKIDRKITSWPALAEKANLAGTWLQDYVMVPGTWSAILRWMPGDHKVRDVQGMREDIEGAMNLRDNSLAIERIGQLTDRVKLSCVTKDPHAEPIPWPGPRVRSISSPIQLGLYSDGKPEMFQWWTPGVGGFHCLVAGLTRSGKSVLLDIMIGSYADAPDVAFALADLKGGSSFLKWAPFAEWFEKDFEGVMEMLRALERILLRRGQQQAERGWDSWQPSRDDPVIVLVIDECAELLGSKATSEGLTLVESIGRMGAGLGVLLVLCTQYPTVGGAIGSSQLKTQLGWRACFRLQASDQLHYILPNAPRGTDPSLIPKSRRGTCFVDAEGEFRTVPLRVMLPARDQVENIVEARWATSTPFDPTARAAAGEYFARRTVWTPDMLRRLKAGETIDSLTKSDLYDEPDAPEDAAPPNTTDKPRKASDEDMDFLTGPNTTESYASMREQMPLTPEEEAERQRLLSQGEETEDLEWARDRMTQALRDAGPAGHSPAELREICKRGEKWVHRTLTRMAEEGSVTHVGRGRYVWSASMAKPSK